RNSRVKPVERISPPDNRGAGWTSAQLNSSISTLSENSAFFLFFASRDAPGIADCHLLLARHLAAQLGFLSYKSGTYR
ncbi:hypothetical protein, partial [Massilia sp.]|uniref:hypothetical protein n=1 Tax=Massilia sp. TaxID=1882437 RepID=UPI00391931B9